MAEENKRPTVKVLSEALGEQFPWDLAADWDNVGLLAGWLHGEVQKILVTLDVTPEVVRRATDQGAHLVVSHHPPFIEPLKRIDDASSAGMLLLALIKSGISLISVHTNADLSPVGVSTWLATRLGAGEVRPLKEVAEEKRYKVVVFVPGDSVEEILQGVFTEGAGRIGHYSRCSFRTAGTGTFFPEEEARPRVGERGKYQEIPEERMEVIVDEVDLPAVLEAIRRHHPYEEPAVDVYPLRPRASRGWLGVVFDVEPPVTLRSFIGRVVEGVKPINMRYAGNLDREVGKVAVLGGSGGSFAGEVAKSDVDLYVSGDLKHHQVHELVEAGKAVIDVGHYDSEKFFIDEVAAFIEGKFGNAVEVERFAEPTEYMKTWFIGREIAG